MPPSGLMTFTVASYGGVGVFGFGLCPRRSGLSPAASRLSLHEAAGLASSALMTRLTWARFGSHATFDTHADAGEGVVHMLVGAGEDVVAELFALRNPSGGEVTTASAEFLLQGR